MEKTFKTLDEQIEILKNKGLIVEDVDSAKEILLHENYFFIMGYRYPFFRSVHDRRFIPNTNFRELYALFNFDRQIRNILFKNILIVENNLKSIFSYQLSKEYGYREKDYLNPKNYSHDPSKKRQVNDLIRKMERQIRVNGGQHTATNHYISNYGYIPLWIVVKVLSFGIVSELFTVLKEEDKNDIAAIYGVPTDELGLYFSIVANYRNLCAHEDILYDHRSQKAILNTKYHQFLNIPKMDEEYIYGKDDLFALIIILKRILRKQDFHLLIQEISYELDYLAGKLKVINIDKIMDAMGFPLNYKEMISV